MNWFFKNRKSEKRSGSQNMTGQYQAEELPFYKRISKNQLFGLSVLFILLCVSVWSIMSRPDVQSVPHLVPGQTAGSTIYAAISFSYIDAEETQKLHAETLAQQPLFFRTKQEKINVLKAELGKFGKLLEEEIKKYTNGKRYDIISIYETCSDRVTKEAEKGVITPEDQKKYYQRTFRIVDHHGRFPIQQRDIDVAHVPSDAAKQITEKIIHDFFSNADDGEKLHIREFFEKNIERILNLAVLEYDEEFTRRMHEQAVKNVRVVQYEYARGVMLLRKGAIVTPKDIKILRYYEAELERVKSPRKMDWIRLGQSVCISLLLILFTAIYISHIHPEVVQSESKMTALGFIIFAALLLNMLFVKLFVYSREVFTIPSQLWYLALPIGFAPIVICTLIGSRLALFSGLYIALVASFSGTNQFNVVIYGLVIGALSSYAVRTCWNYRSLFLRGVSVLTISSSILAIVFCWKDSVFKEMFPWAIILPITISVITIVLVQFSLFILESIFDLSSRISLNLCCDYNHPLLKEMQLKTPGTYHHSLIVSILAEAATEAVGADAVKARVGALFHDVGKMSRPIYYTENSNGENMHEKLSPQESALIITDHVREGMKLAKEYTLKRPIRDAIEQHHGTDLVYYFYKLAKDSGEEINEKDYRYDGPKPQSKEIAIISLADACEAASRSLDKPTPEQIFEMVNMIIHKRQKEGQLDDCTLTFRDLATIRDSFVKTLISILHARVAYPKDEEKDNENDLFVDAERKASSEKKS